MQVYKLSKQLDLGEEFWDKVLPFEDRTVYTPMERVVGTEMNTQNLTLGFKHLKVEQRKVTAKN